MTVDGGGQHGSRIWDANVSQYVSLCKAFHGLIGNKHVSESDTVDIVIFHTSSRAALDEKCLQFYITQVKQNAKSFFSQVKSCKI